MGPGWAQPCAFVTCFCVVLVAGPLTENPCSKEIVILPHFQLPTGFLAVAHTVPWQLSALRPHLPLALTTVPSPLCDLSLGERCLLACMLFTGFLRSVFSLSVILHPLALLDTLYSSHGQITCHFSPGHFSEYLSYLTMVVCQAIMDGKTSLRGNHTLNRSQSFPNGPMLSGLISCLCFSSRTWVTWLQLHWPPCCFTNTQDIQTCCHLRTFALPVPST